MGGHPPPVLPEKPVLAPMQLCVAIQSLSKHRKVSRPHLALQLCYRCKARFASPCAYRRFCICPNYSEMFHVHILILRVAMLRVKPLLFFSTRANALGQVPETLGQGHLSSSFFPVQLFVIDFQCQQLLQCSGCNIFSLTHLSPQLNTARSPSNALVPFLGGRVPLV